MNQKLFKNQIPYCFWKLYFQNKFYCVLNLFVILYFFVFLLFPFVCVLNLFYGSPKFIILNFLYSIYI
jgi:hypothetical protein